MANAGDYVIDYTDGVRSFTVAPYTTNGPQSPTSTLPADGATAIETSLIFHGKGRGDFGERTNENFLHILENFAGATEPTNPIKGQLWWHEELTGSPIIRRLEVYDGTTWKVLEFAGLAAATGNLDMSGFKIINLGAPSAGSNDAVRQVDIEALVLNDLADVTAPTPSLNEFLVYDGGWVNKTGTNAGVLQLSGGIMNGFLTLFADPTVAFHAATKQYVDNAVSSGGFTCADLNTCPIESLSNVTVGGSPPSITAGDLLQYDGATWSNLSPLAAGLLELTGGTMTGNLFLASDPTPPGSPASPRSQAATANYVDQQIAAIPQDRYINGTNFDFLTSVITYFYSDGAPSITTDLSTLTVSASTVNYTVPNPPTTPPFPDGLAWERAFAQTTYPTATMEQTHNELNSRVGAFMAPRSRIVFQPVAPQTGSPVGSPIPAPAPYRVNLGDSSTSPILDQINPTGAVNMNYHVGFGDLQVYVNRQKLIASEYGFFKIVGEDFGSPINPYGLWDGTSAEFDNVSTYSFQISVNGGPYVQVDFDSSVTILARLGDVASVINALSESNSLNFSVILWGGQMVFYSGTPGLGSSISIIDGPAGGSPLGSPQPLGFFANLGGSTYTIPLTGSPLGPVGVANAYPPVDGDFVEVGRVGSVSTVFEFFTSGSPPTQPGSPPFPTVGDTIEVVIDREPYKAG